MKNEEIIIFLNKANTTHWAKNYPDEVLPFDEYYKILFKSSCLVKKLAGYFEKNNTTNAISIFKNSNNLHIAQVASYKKFESHIKYNKAQLTPYVTVATYLNRHNRIILLSHFDAVGLIHCNNYSIYPERIRPLYETYFTDNVIEQNGQTYYHSNCPHFHFNTAYQTQMFQDQEHVNAISVKQLINYLTDLKTSDEESLLMKEDLGMPFLTYFKYGEKYKYISIFNDLSSKILEGNSKIIKQDGVTEYMQKIQRIISLKQPNSNLDKIILDLQILNKLIKKFPNNLELIAVFSNAFVKSVNNKTTEVYIKPEIE